LQSPSRHADIVELIQSMSAEDVVTLTVYARAVSPAAFRVRAHGAQDSMTIVAALHDAEILRSVPAHQKSADFQVINAPAA
jgi:hypothetical protein